MLLKELGLQKRTITAFNKKNIYTVDDMARLFPRDYRDYRSFSALNDSIIGKYVAIKGYVNKAEVRGAKIKCAAADIIEENSGAILHVSWFGNALMRNVITMYANRNIVVCGKVTKHEKYGFQMESPDIFDLIENYKPKIQSIYPKYKGISEEMLKSTVYKAIKATEEPLEHDVFSGMSTYKEALYALHYPKCGEDIKKGKTRLLFNQLLYFSLKQKLNIKDITNGIVLSDSTTTNAFINQLPFKLSADQDSISKEILNITASGERLQMLVQGDVGCGKTMIAFITLLNAYENGYQSVLLAPTQVLAEQHYNELKERLADYNIPVVLLSGSQKASEKNKILKGIKSGEHKIIIGTTSAISKAVEYQNLAVVVIDEEHKFGVAQKERVYQKALPGAHVLLMSATPIPRTLASSIFGENTKVRDIKSMPNGRKPIQTAQQIGHANTFPFMEKQIKEGHQCYVVCPAVKSQDESLVDLKNIEDVKKEYEEFFCPKGVKIGVVHGGMKKEDIDEEINSFQKNETQILMATTVIEVGVNVPNTTLIVIEQADRFGLASLHQLRGRVGRNSLQSYCILVSKDKNNERLKTMCNETSGFVIAKKDLELRGAGNLIGTSQSGFDIYLETAIKYPKFYEGIKKVADTCIEKGYGNKLIELYQEHELCKENAAS